jgi:hypothetical protein
MQPVQQCSNSQAATIGVILFTTTIYEESNLAHLVQKLLAVTALVLHAILLRLPKVYDTITPLDCV